jgi:hypothetical protein
MDNILDKSHGEMDGQKRKGGAVRERIKKERPLPQTQLNATK